MRQIYSPSVGPTVHRSVTPALSRSPAWSLALSRFVSHALLLGLVLSRSLAWSRALPLYFVLSFSLSFEFPLLNRSQPFLSPFLMWRSCSSALIRGSLWRRSSIRATRFLSRSTCTCSIGQKRNQMKSMHLNTSFAEGKVKLGLQIWHTFFDSSMSAKFTFFFLVPATARVNCYNKKIKR